MSWHSVGRLGVMYGFKDACTIGVSLSFGKHENEMAKTRGNGDVHSSSGQQLVGTGVVLR